MRRPFPTTRLLALAPVLALAVAALTLLLHDDLKADPQGWLRWGREIVGADPFSTVGYPSWKPLPTLFTVPLALTGSAAGDLWLVLARAGGFLALLMAFLLARRLGGLRAGVVAVVALALAPQWWPTLLGGQIEPTLVALGLLAVLRHLDGHPRQAMLCGALVALGREEAWALLAVYALAMLPGRRNELPFAAGVLVLVPVVWMGGDWIGSGSPVHGGEIAHQALDAQLQRATGSVPLLTLTLAAKLLLAPLWCAAAVAVVLGLRRGHRLPAALAGLALLWVGLDVLAAASGMPAQARFMLPAAGLLAVLAGVGGDLLLRVASTGPAPAAAATLRGPWLGPRPPA